MITGVYRDKHPRVTLDLPGINGTVLVEFIVDTAFDGDLKLSPETAAKLDLTYRTMEFRTLADGEKRRYPIYDGVIDWADGIREVEVLVMDGNDLLGTGLLEGVSVYIEGQEGAEVVFEAL